MIKLFKKSEKVAIFIDGDNVSPKCADFVIDYAKKLGHISVKRIYGTPDTMKAWVSEYKKYAIKQVSLYNSKYKKNGADIALTFDAATIGNKPMISSVVIVSNDSDFLPLVVKLKESGKVVYSFGSDINYSEPFANACDYFIPLPKIKKRKSAVS